MAFLLLTTGTALAQERLLVRAQCGANGETQLTELDTSDAKLGTILRTADLPPYTNALAVAGGRYLILYWPNFELLTTTLALFDTRSFTAAPLAHWTFTGLKMLAADDFQPRIFYRMANEVGVIEGPSFAPRVLRGSGVDSPGCCTTHFMVEVGTIPGRSNVGILHVGNVTSWSVDDVPSGTYYLRVRAGNNVGPSLPSNEVIITVP